MFGKAHWFQKRKYGGWGLAPRTWQGWVYILVFMGVLLTFHALPFWSTATRVAFTTVWALLLFFDTLFLMATMKKDELEKKQEALAERNASWAMVFFLTLGILYQIISSGLHQKLEVDIFLILALVAGMAVKGISYVVMEKR